jgi:hypothetical protein
MFFHPWHILGGTVGVGSRYHVLHTQTSFQRYRGHRVMFSCFAIPGTFSAVRRASSLEIIFCAPSLFSAVPRALIPVFIFCTPGFIFSGTEGFRSRFHVLRARTRFQRYRGRLVPFSYFARPDSFSAVPRVSDPLFMFSAPGHVFGGAEGVGTCF